MGQAKLRGWFEERQALAIDEEALQQKLKLIKTNERAQADKKFADENPELILKQRQLFTYMLASAMYSTPG